MNPPVSFPSIYSTKVANLVAAFSPAFLPMVKPTAKQGRNLQIIGRTLNYCRISASLHRPLRTLTRSIPVQSVLIRGRLSRRQPVGTQQFRFHLFELKRPDVLR